MTAHHPRSAGGAGPGRPVRCRPWGRLVRFRARRGRACGRLPAGHHQLRPPSLQCRWAGLRPGHHDVQVPPSGPAAGRGPGHGHRRAGRRPGRPRASWGRWRSGPWRTSRSWQLEEGRFPLTDSIGYDPSRAASGSPRWPRSGPAPARAETVRSPAIGSAGRRAPVIAVQDLDDPGAEHRQVTGSRWSRPCARSTNRSDDPRERPVAVVLGQLAVDVVLAAPERRDQSAGRGPAAADRGRR